MRNKTDGIELNIIITKTDWFTQHVPSVQVAVDFRKYYYDWDLIVIVKTFFQYCDGMNKKSKQTELGLKNEE